MHKILKKLDIRSKLFLSFGIIIVILLALSTTFYMGLSNIYKSNSWNIHTYQVLISLDNIQTSMVNMETGQRGFCITGEESFLEPFKKGKTDFDVNLAHAKQLTSDNPKQQEILATIEKDQEEWYAIAKKYITSRREVQTAAQFTQNIINQEKLGEGKKHMDKIRDSISQSKQIEENLLAERNKKVDNLKNTIYLIVMVGTLIAIIFALTISLIISRNIVYTIKKTLAMLKDIAEGDGDLTKRLNVVSNDEIGQLAHQFNMFIEKLHNLIKHIKEDTNIAADNAKCIAVAIEETTISINDVAKTIEELADNATNQATEAHESSQKVVQFGEEIATVTSAANLIKTVTNDVQKAGEKGLDNLNDLSAKFNYSNEITQLVSDNVESLAVKSTSINTITNAIKAVADQTNLLALNAAIEAARAGEVGRGFAVVAEEIRKLAEQTTHSTQEIEAIINDIQQKISSTKTNVEKNSSIFKESKDSFEKTANTFNKIVKEVEKVATEIDTLTNSIDNVDTNKQDIIKNIEDIATIAQSSAAATQEVSATVEEQSVTIENIAQKTENLKVIANKLELEMDKFKL